MTKHRSMDPLLLIGSIILLAALMTWILPAGRFVRVLDPHTARTLVVPGSYAHVARNPIGLWGALTSIPQGLVEAADVVFFVLLGGAAITVIEATGAIGNFLNLLMRRLGHRPLLVLAIASVIFLFGGAGDNMYEEVLAFLPLLCLLMRRLGLDSVMALAISVGTATVAGVFSPFNTFTLGIAQPLAELKLFSGFAFRSVFFVLALAIWGGYLAWYALKYQVAPTPPEPDEELHTADTNKWSTGDIWVLVVLNGGIAVIVLGGIFLNWGLREFSAIFVLMALVGGLAGGLGWNGTSQHFAEGLRRMALAAALIGFARAISTVLANGLILDTIANALFSPLRHLPLGMSAAGDVCFGIDPRISPAQRLRQSHDEPSDPPASGRPPRNLPPDGRRHLPIQRPGFKPHDAHRRRSVSHARDCESLLRQVAALHGRSLRASLCPLNSCHRHRSQTQHPVTRQHRITRHQPSACNTLWLWTPRQTKHSSQATCTAPPIPTPTASSSPMALDRTPTPRSSSLWRTHSSPQELPFSATISPSASRARTGHHHAAAQSAISRDFARRLGKCDSKPQDASFSAVIPTEEDRRRSYAPQSPSLVDSLLLLSYPLHPPQRPTDLRTAHLPNLKTPTLFVQGTKDGFGSIDEMAEALKLIPARTELLPIAGAGHELVTKNNHAASAKIIVEAFQRFVRQIQ